MSISIIKGDLLSSEIPICHVTNNYGVMGSGLAPQIKKKFPKVFKRYEQFCEYYQKDYQNLRGKTQFVTENGMTVINIFSMPTMRSFSHIDFATALNHLSYQLTRLNFDKSLGVSMPFGIGCKLAGGDIFIVNTLLEEWSRLENIPVTLYVFNTEEWCENIVFDDEGEIIGWKHR